MTSTHQFVKQLEAHVHERLAGLDLLKEPEIGAVDRLEIVRRLKMALKNELEASEIAAAWIPTTPEIEVKLYLAGQRDLHFYSRCGRDPERGDYAGLQFSFQGHFQTPHDFQAIDRPDFRLFEEIQAGKSLVDMGFELFNELMRRGHRVSIIPCAILSACRYPEGSFSGVWSGQARRPVRNGRPA